jgi:hypothetical protein
MYGGTLPGRSSLTIRILGGLFRITHIKQFILFGLSICVLLWIVRLIHLKTFSILVLLGCLSILILSIIEHFLFKPAPDPEHVRLLDRDPSVDHLTFQNTLFSSGSFRTLSPRSSGTKCLICEKPFFPDDEVTLTDCRHIFHRQCFQEWTTVEISCPACQTSLV